MMSDEISVEKSSNLNIFNIDYIDRLVSKREVLESNQLNIIKSASVSLFFAALAWNGTDIKIPLIDATIGQIPYLLQGMLIIASISLTLLPLTFASIQIYQGLIDVTVANKIGNGIVDPVPIAASHTPMWLVINYANPIPVAGIPHGLGVKGFGRYVFSSLVVVLIVFMLLLFFIFYFSLIFLSYMQYSDQLITKIVFFLSIGAISISMLTLVASFVRFEYALNIVDNQKGKEKLP